jgi:hypothetical protein
VVEEVMTHEEVLAGEERLRSGKSVLDVGCNIENAKSQVRWS